MFSTLANRLSFLRIVLSPIFFMLFISGEQTLEQVSLGVFAIAALTDWYDGVLARSSNTITNVGKFLDPLADKVLTSAAFFAFAWIGLVHWWMVVLIVLRDIAITLLRSLAELRGAHITTSRSAQTKTFIQMTVLYYLLLVVIAQDVVWVRASVGDIFPALLDPTFIEILMSAVTLITLATGVQYIVDNWSFVRSLSSRSNRVAG